MSVCRRAFQLSVPGMLMAIFLYLWIESRGVIAIAIPVLTPLYGLVLESGT